MGALDDLLSGGGGGGRRRTGGGGSHSGSLNALLKGASAPASKSGKGVKGVIDPTDIAKTQKGIGSHLKKILESEAPESEKEAAKAEAEGKGKKSWFSKALDVLDTPRAAAAAGLHQLSQLNPRAKTVTLATYDDGTPVIDPATGKQQVLSIEKGIDADFSEDFKKHIGVGEILSENAEFQKLPTPVKIAAGFVGDVAFDPLSYLAPEAKIAKLGGKVGIAKLFELAGKNEVAAKVLQKGVSSLDKAERAEVGIRGGLYFNVPGTGHVVNKAAAVFGKKVPLKQIRLFEGAGRLSSAVPRALQGAGGAWRTTETAKFLSRHLAGKNAILKADLKSGDPVLALSAMHGLEAINQGPLKSAFVELTQGRKIRNLIEDAEKKGVNLDDLTEAVRGDPDATARVLDAGVDLDAHRQWWDETRQVVNDTAGEEVIKHQENYVARFRSEQARELTGVGGRQAAPHTPTQFEHRRLRPGDEWMGHELYEPGAEVGGVAQGSVEKQIADINAKTFGDAAVPLYEKDYRKIVGGYLSGVSKRAGEKWTERTLLERGVIKDRYAEVRPKKGTVKRMAKAQRLEEEADRLVTAQADAQSELDMAERLLATHNAQAADEVTAAGREHRANAQLLEENAERARVGVAQVHEEIAERLGVVREARQRVSTVIGETNQQYERYTDLLDRREGLAERIDELEELRAEGRSVRAEMRELNVEANKLNDQLDKLGAHPRVVAGLRQGMDLAEGKAANLRRLLAEFDGVTDAEAKLELANRISAEMGGRTYGPEEATLDFDPGFAHQEVDKLDIQAELHRRELERMGVDPDEPPGRALPEIEAEAQALAEPYTAAKRTADEWAAAHTRATLFSETANHTDAVEAAEQIRRLKESTGLSTAQEARAQANALRDQVQALKREHYARRAYEGQVLPEDMAGTPAQVRAKLNRVQAQRERLGVEWNLYDERLSKMESELDALKENADGVFEHAPRASTRFGPSEGAQSTSWFHFTDAEDLNFAQDPMAKGQLNTWGGLHAADNPLSSGEGPFGDNFIEFELHTSPDRVKVYGENHMGELGEAFPAPQEEVNQLGGDLSDVYGIPHSYGEAEQQADMFRAAWDREIITPKSMADRNPHDAVKWNEVGRILDENPDADVVDAIAHAWSEGTVDDFDDLDGLDFEGAHPHAPANSVINDLAHRLPHDVKQEVREAYRQAMKDEGYDAVVYWNETESAAMERGGGAHWSLIVTDPSAARIINQQGDEAFRAEDYLSYSDRIESRAMTGIDRYELEATERALQSSDDLVNQAEIALVGQQQAVLDNQDRLRQIEEYVGADVLELSGKAKRLAAEEYSLREEADAAWRHAASEEVKAQGPLVQQTQALEASRLQAEAKLAELGFAQLEARNLATVARNEANEKFATQAVDALHDGLVPWGRGQMAPEHLAEALTEVQKVATPEGMKDFLHYHDKALNFWKSWAVMSPGFHMRNFFGGQFNMYLQGVDPGVQTRFAKAYTQFWSALGKSNDHLEALTHIKNARYRDVMKQVFEAGIIGNSRGQFGDIVTPGRGKFNPASSGFAPLRANLWAGNRVEDVMRGASAAHVLENGGTIDDAISAVMKYHFDYEDLSRFEKGVAKRVVPFYTWTRKNFALQLEHLIREPKKYKRYLDVKRNIEQQSTPTGDPIPDYFGKQLGIRLPWRAQGEDSYVLPDVPFKSLATDSPADLAASMSPFVKTPLELWSGKQFFAGLPITGKKTIAPKAWGSLMPALKTMGLAQKDKDGRYIMSQKNSYLVEQFFPLLQRARRLSPSEPKYEERVNTTYLSFLFGVGARTATTSAQYSELRRRDRKLQGIIADLKQRGYLESSEPSY